MAKFIPHTDREHQVVNSLGADDWEVMKHQDKVVVFNNQPGVMIKKNNHIRWTKPHQVVLPQVTPGEVKEDVPANSMSGGGIATFSPIMSFKMFRRKYKKTQ